MTYDLVLQLDQKREACPHGFSKRLAPWKAVCCWTWMHKKKLVGKEAPLGRSIFCLKKEMKLLWTPHGTRPLGAMTVAKPSRSAV